MVSAQERVPVVTAFIYSGDKVALVKRSQSVGTYPGAWAGFSGYVERLPLEQARLELLEEAGIASDQVALEGIGIPIEVDDEEANLHWLVFPFLFRLLDGVQIRTDWEADDLQWYRHAEIASLHTVPGLARALAAVWPSFGSRELWDGFSEIATNRREGATELARRGMRTLGAYADENWKQLNHPQLLRAIRAFAATRPSMGAFPDLAARLILAIDSEGGQYTLDDLLVELLGAVDDATRLCVEGVDELLWGTDRLFTLSYSETVREAIMKWQHETCTVVIAESSPGKEGLYLAEYLHDQDVNVEIVDDADIESAVEATDVVLVGCDSITEDDQIQNELHTRRAVLTAQQAGIPAYAIAQTFKITPPGWPVFLERQLCEVDDCQSERKIERVFDLTPFSAFRAVFSEEGILTLDRISEIRNKLQSIELLPLE